VKFVRARARNRPDPNGMNKTERAYRDHLALRELAGEIQGFRFEGLKLRLADSTFYSPDFLVILADGLVELHEVKGHWEDDARVKFKVAQEQFPWLQLVAVKRAKGGGWQFERLR